MIEYDALKPYADRYAAMDCCQALRVMLILRPGSRLAGYDPLNLDNLLARAVVDEATQGAGLPNSTEPYLLPVPLQCLWRSPAGLPLWAATPFTPVGFSTRDIAYWHKRQQSGRWTGTKRGTFTITATKGRWMERRVPLPVTVCNEFVVHCMGHAEEIARLLKPLTFVGKRRTNGFGEVQEWRVEVAETFDLVQEGRLTRALPALALELLPLGTVPEGQPAPVGWTPPQWKPSLFAPGWWPGTRVTQLCPRG